MKKSLFFILFILLGLNLTLANGETILEKKTILNAESGHIQIQKIESSEGVIFWRVIGFIGGEIISSVASAMAESACSAFGGHNSTCSFVGEAAGMLVGMKRGRRTTARTSSHTYTSSRNYQTARVSSKVKYNARKNEGEVEYQSSSKEAVEYVASSLASHYFNGLLSNLNAYDSGYYDQQNNSAQYQNRSSTYRTTVQQMYQKTCTDYLNSLARLYNSYLFEGKNRKAKKTLKEYNKVKAECERW